MPEPSPSGAPRADAPARPEPDTAEVAAVRAALAAAAADPAHASHAVAYHLDCLLTDALRATAPMRARGLHAKATPEEQQNAVLARRALADAADLARRVAIIATTDAALPRREG